MAHETLIRCTTAKTLEWDENHEKPVDRIVALAHATRRNDLGGLMLRVEALDAASLRKAILFITRTLAHTHNINRAHGERIAVAVLREILHPGCPCCGGKGEIHRENEATTLCNQCRGTGLHRYSNADRMGMVGGKLNSKAYETALNQARDALVRAVRSANKHLTSK